MHCPRKSLAVAGAVALVSIGTAAYADPPWTVSVGGSSTGPAASYTASTIGDGTADIELTVPAFTMTCSDGTLAGTIAPGATSSTAGEITSTSINGCEVLGIPWEFTQQSVWDINITGDSSGGVTPISIGNLSAHMENPDGLCEFDLNGTVAGEFDENTQQLAIDGNGVIVSNVSGCFGAFGNNASLKATYQLDNIAEVTVAN